MLQQTLKVLSIFITSLLAASLSFGQGAGNAIVFDGFDDHILSSTDNRGISNQVTVFAWVKTTSTKNQWIAGKYDRNEKKGYYLYIEDGKAAFGGGDGSTIYRTSGLSTSKVNDGNWHNIVGVCNNDTWRIYIDAVPQAELKTGFKNTNLANSAPLVIGKNYQANNQFFEGTIDEVRIWKMARGQGLGDTGLGDICLKSPAYASEIVAHFDFDEGDGSIVKDNSSLKIDATLINMSTPMAWVVSGAPLGDYGWAFVPTFNSGVNLTGRQHQTSLSYYKYLADGTKFFDRDIRILIESIGEASRGIYFYTIHSDPNNTNGINLSKPATSYFGIFTPLYPNVKYKVSYISGQEECSSRLFERHDNSTQQWHELQTTIRTDTATGLGTSSRGEYIIDQIPSQNLKIQGNLSFCRGSNTQLTINTSGSVEWSNGASGKSIIVSKPGIYEATITLGNCVITKRVEVTETPLPAFSLGQDLTVCQGERVSLQGPDQMASYTWSTGAKTQSIEVSQPGTYWIDVTSESGCTVRESINIIIIKEPVLEIPLEAVTCPGEKVAIDATVDGATYLWSNGETTPKIEVVSPASVSVDITIEGCTYTKAFNVTDEECIIIPNVITPNGDNKNDFFVISGASPADIEIEIFSRLGVSVYKKVGYDGDWAAQNLTAGTYYYVVKSSRSNRILKGWVEIIL